MNGMSLSTGTSHWSNAVTGCPTYAAPNSEVRPSARNSMAEPARELVGAAPDDEVGVQQREAGPDDRAGEGADQGLPVSTPTA